MLNVIILILSSIFILYFIINVYTNTNNNNNTSYGGNQPKDTKTICGGVLSVFAWTEYNNNPTDPNYGNRYILKIKSGMISEESGDFNRCMKGNRLTFQYIAHPMKGVHVGRKSTICPEEKYHNGGQFKIHTILKNGTYNAKRIGSTWKELRNYIGLNEANLHMRVGDEIIKQMSDHNANKGQSLNGIYLGEEAACKQKYDKGRNLAKGTWGTETSSGGEVFVVCPTNQVAQSDVSVLLLLTNIGKNVLKAARLYLQQLPTYLTKNNYDEKLWMCKNGYYPNPDPPMKYVSTQIVNDVMNIISQ